MELTKSQYNLIHPFLPRQRGNCIANKLQVLNAILYVAEQGCKLRGLPKIFENWHTIYTRMNRWAKRGVLDRVFAALQQQQIIQVRVEAVSLDSTAVKVHPDGTGAQKKRTARHREISGRVDHHDSSGCRRCSNGGELFLIPGPCRGCHGRPGAAEADEVDGHLYHHGSCL